MQNGLIHHPLFVSTFMLL